MYFVYSLVLSLLFIVLLPYFVYQALRRGKYSGSFKERLGRLPASLRDGERKTIWVHAVSVGEFLAARPLITRLKRDVPEARIVVSTTTLTGQQLARSQSQSFDAAFYFPFDWRFSVRRALDTVNPTVVVIMETELWPNFLRECHKRGIATVLANGRISPRSFRRYQLVGAPFKRALENVSLMIMQSEDDAERARKLGAPATRVRICGNLKYDLPSNDRRGPSDEVSGAVPCEIDHQFALSLSRHLIVAGSTAPGEEEMLISSLRTIRGHAGLDDARLVLAPRHPERFDEVARLISKSEFTLARRSGSRTPSDSSVAVRNDVTEPPGNSPGRKSAGPRGAAADIILLDTIGELASIYRFAAVVFVGGSLVPRGGHNIIEPAAFEKPIIVGPHTENFRQVVADFAEADALVQIADAGEDAVNRLARELIHLLSDCERARSIGKRAGEILLKNQGATGCTAGMIIEIMKVRGIEIAKAE